MLHDKSRMSWAAIAIPGRVHADANNTPGKVAMLKPTVTPGEVGMILKGVADFREAWRIAMLKVVAVVAVVSVVAPTAVVAVVTVTRATADTAYITPITCMGLKRTFTHVTFVQLMLLKAATTTLAILGQIGCRSK